MTWEYPNEVEHGYPPCVVGKGTSRDEVVDASEMYVDILDEDGEEWSYLVCNVCDLWVGDTSVPSIAHVSIDHSHELCAAEWQAEQAENEAKLLELK